MAPSSRHNLQRILTQKAPAQLPGLFNRPSRNGIAASLIQSLMADNTERFTGRVREYEKYRLRYPAGPVLALLREWCVLSPDGLVADIGAGTGMLAEIFLENGNEVIAVEPNAEMRAACEQLAERWPKLHTNNGTAEQTGIKDASIDLVTAGRAFHWFDQKRALPEFRRILKPGRWVALISAGRSKHGSVQSETYERLLMEHGIDYAYVREGYRVHENMNDLFPGGEVRQTEIPGEQKLSFEELVGQTMSLSVAPLEGHPKHAAMLQALEQFFVQFATDGRLTAPTTCWVTCGRFAINSALTEPNGSSLRNSI